MRIEKFEFFLFFLIINSDLKEARKRSKIRFENLSKFPDNCFQEESDSPSYLWRLERGPFYEPVYFFGTIHVSYPRVWPHVPTNSKEVITNSDEIYFELDLTDERTMTSLQRCQLLPDDVTIDQLLPESMFNRLFSYINFAKTKIADWMTNKQWREGLTSEMLFEMVMKDWKKKKAFWLSLILQSLSEDETKIRHLLSFDVFLIRRANDLKKSFKSIEDVEEHCKMLNGLSLEQEIFALNQTLKQLEEVQNGKRSSRDEMRNDLIRQYTCLRLTHQHLQATLPTKKAETEIASSLDEYFQLNMNLKRNLRMSKRILKIINKSFNKKILFVFGVGHFLGNGSIIDLLEKKGFNITRIPASFASTNRNHRSRSHKLMTSSLKKISSQNIGSSLTMTSSSIHLSILFFVFYFSIFNIF